MAMPGDLFDDVDDNLEEEHLRSIEQARLEREAVAAQLNAAGSTAQDRADGPAPNADPQGASPSPSESDPNEGGVIDTLQDVGAQTLGGIFDGLDAILQLPYDLVGSDEEVDIFPPVEPSENVSGQIARGIGQILPGVLPGIGAVRMLSAASKSVKALQAARTALGTGVLKSGVKSAAIYGVADFAAFDGNEGRLTDMLAEVSQEYPALDALVFDYLRSDPDDSAMEGRFKNALEGLMIGGVVDFSLHGIHKAARNLRWSNAQSGKLVTAGAPRLTVKAIRDSESTITFLGDVIEEVDGIKLHLRGGADEVPVGGAADEAASPPRDPAFDEPLGLSRPPVIDVELSQLSDVDFEQRAIEVKQRVDNLERQYDENPELIDTDAAFRRDLAEAQDRFTAVEMEEFRRLYENNEVDVIAEAIYDLGDLAVDDNKLKALLLSDIISKRDIQNDVLEHLRSKVSGDPDKSEVLAGKLQRIESVLQEQEDALRGVGAGGAADEADVVSTVHGSNKVFDNVSLDLAREGDNDTVHGWGVNLESRKGPDGNLVSKTDFGEHTYQVDVNAPAGKILDHDKPLTEQHLEVQAVFERLKAKYPEWDDIASRWGSGGEPLTGRGAYWVLEQIHTQRSGLEQGAARKAASLELAGEGVSGAKYAAMGGADGFVIWDEGVLRTVSRDGAPIPRAEATTPNTIPAEALARIEAINPDLARRVRAGLEEVDKLSTEAHELMAETTDDWVKLRTSEEAAVLKDEEWAAYDEKIGKFLSPEQVEQVNAYKSIPLNKRQQRLRLARDDAEAAMMRATRESRAVNARDLMVDPSRFAGRLALDKTAWNELKVAIAQQDVDTVVRIANEKGIILESDFPDKGQTWTDYLKTKHGKEWDRIVQKAIDRTAARSENTRQPKTGKQSDKKFKDVSKGGAKRMAEAEDALEKSKTAPDEATPESLVEFAQAIDGRLDVHDAPEVLNMMDRIQLSMRATMMQRAGAIKEGIATDLEKAEFDQIAEQLAIVSDALRGNVTRFAQTLASRRINVNGRASNAWFADMRDHLKETRFSDKKRQQFATSIIEARDERAITRAIGKGTRRGPKDMLVEFYTNSILSGPITLAIQPISNTMLTLYLPMEAIAGAALRLDLRGVKTEMAAFRGLMETFRGAIRMTGQLNGTNAVPVQINGANVLENTWETLKSGSGTLDARTVLDDSAHAIAARNFGFQDKTTAGSLINALGNIVRMPGRLIATADEVAKGFNYNMRLSRDGYEDALAKGITDIDGHVREYMRQANDWHNVQNKELSKIWRQRHEDALQYARTATFQQDLTDGMAKSIQSFTSKHPMMKLVIPFIRTPANILKFVGQRTPLLNRISRDIRDDLEAGGAKAQSVHDRLNVATALWSTSMLMVHQGLVTGAGPSDRKERQVWFDAGWRPYSIWAGENEDGTQNWISFQRADPLGMFLGLSADLATGFSNMDDGDPEMGELAAAGMFALVNNLKSRSYFMGVSSLMNALDNPERFAQRYLQNQFANMIPNLSAQIRKYGPVGGDDAMYEVNGLLETLANRIPFYEHNLKPKRNIYGEIQRYPTGASMAIINPFYSADNGISPEMLKGLRRGDIDARTLSPEQQVSAAAIQLNFAYSMKGYDSMKKVDLTPEQRDFWIVETGRGLKEHLQTLVTSPGWRELGDPIPGAEKESGKYKAFSRVIQRKKRAARLATIRQFPELQSSLIARAREKQARLLNKPDAVLAGGN